MDSEQKFWLSFWVAMVCIVLGLATIVAIWDYQKDKMAFDRGYQRQTMFGSAEKEWQKVK